MKTTKKLPTEENNKLAQELHALTDNWLSKSFNFIQLAVLEKMSDGMLFEHIRQIEPDVNNFIRNYEIKVPAKVKKKDHFRLEFVKHTYGPDFEEYTDSIQQDNYPMWNTCFEFRDKTGGELFAELAQKAGFGIIEGLDDFNTILFVAGAGYSFYAQHWIPLFLSLPFNSDLAKKYKDVDYSHM